jgi:hypothetical protein
MAQGVEYVRNVGVALLCAVGVVVGLEYNRQLTEQTMFECKLETGLKKVLPALTNPTHFVVKMKGMKFGLWGSGCSSSMPTLFAETVYNSNAVWLDPVYEGKPRASKPVTFGSDQLGVYSAESSSWVECKDVIFVEFDGQNVTRLTNIDRVLFLDTRRSMIGQSRLLQDCRDAQAVSPFRPVQSAAAPEATDLGLVLDGIS